MSEDERRGDRRRQNDEHNDAVAQNIAALAAVVEATARNVHMLSDEVREMRKTIVPRSTLRRESSQIALQRRRSVVVVAVFAVTLIWGHDEHVEHCSPGARASLAIQVFLDTDYTPITPREVPSAERKSAGVKLQEDIRRALDGDARSTFCDVSFPLHDHDGNGWPHKHNLLGMVVWGSAAGLAYLWARPRTEKRPNDSRA